MASPDLTAGQVMDLAAARLNDVSKSKYTYAVQIPFLNLALLDLQEIYEANNVPVTDDTSAIIYVPSAPAGVVEIGFSGTAGRILPADLIELKVVWQSTRNLNQWTRLSPVDYLPQWGVTQISSFSCYQWADQKLKVIAANADNDLKLNYIKSLFATVTAAADQLNIINGKTYLVNQTASYVALDVEENELRATALRVDANNSLDKSLTITTKGRQKIQTRRLPFRAGFKSRNN